MKRRKAYIVGGGIAGLASAAYLIREGAILGEDITIFDVAKKMNGGSLDAEKVDHGYLMRGHRAIEEKSYNCLLDLLSFIPSLEDEDKTLKDEFFEFDKKIGAYEHARLVEHKKVIDGSVFQFGVRDKLDFFRLIFRSEKSLGVLRLEDYFQESFFKTNFWFEFRTLFAFQPWHSLVEFRRYVLRFVHQLHNIEDLHCLMVAPYNQYESVVLPLLKWLKNKGVEFEKGTLVYDLDFKKVDDQRVVENILYVKDGQEKQIKIKDEDFVFVTNGSMTSASSCGSMTKKPEKPNPSSVTRWCLWNNMARKSLHFGRPEVFNNRTDESNWESFTITFKNSLFFDLMEKFTQNKSGTGFGTTIKSSNWVLTLVLPHQPHFRAQPDGTYVCWGYALFVDEEGNYVKKKMTECTGEEILRELCYHFGFEDQMEDIVKSANCIPCFLPYITSQFLTRKMGDRPNIRPPKTTNLAFIGQFCEQKDDVVFTDEYSVRSAQTAVYSLLGLKKKALPIYHGYLRPWVMLKALKTMFFTRS